MLVMLICMMVGAMFFRWLQDEDYMKNFGAIIGSFTGLFKWSKCRYFCSRSKLEYSYM